MGDAPHTGSWQQGQITLFFDILIHKLSVQRQATARLNRFLSTQFNTFDLIQPGELTLSKILANLLSPLGSHGQGDSFLRAFVQQLQLEPGGNFEKVRILTEERTVSTNSFVRRHDLLLDFGDFRVSLENKPFAAEQPNQISDYLSDLEARYGARHCLVYLTASGAEPQSIDLERKILSLDSRRLILMSYSIDLPTLKSECIGVCDSDRFRWFLRDFLGYLTATFPSVPGMETTNAV